MTSSPDDYHNDSEVHIHTPGVNGLTMLHAGDGTLYR